MNGLNDTPTGSRATPRWMLVGLAAGLAGLVVLVGILLSQDGTDSTLTASTPPTSDSTGNLPNGHAADAVDVEVRGPASTILAAEVQHGVTIFPTGEPAELVVTLTATDDASISEMPFHRAIARAEGGEGAIGYRGVCGRGWDRDGRTDPDELKAVSCRRGPATTMVGAPGGGEITCDMAGG